MVSTEFACFKQMADSLVEEFDDGLHGSTRPGNRSRIVSQWTSDTQRPRARAVRGSTKGVPQTDAKLARSRSVCVKMKCSRWMWHQSILETMKNDEAHGSRLMYSEQLQRESILTLQREG